MPVGRSVLQRPEWSAGQRDRFVTIQQATDGTGPSGYPMQTWTDLATAFMSRFDLSADERFVVGQESAYQQTRWNMHYRPDMDPELVDCQKERRLVYGGRAYDIISASPIGRQQAIEFITIMGSKVEAA